MRRSQTLLFLLLVVAANIAVLYWRYQHTSVEIPGVGPYVAALGRTQVETVLAWQNAQSVKFSPASISDLAERMTWETTDGLPTDAVSIERDNLSQDEQADLLKAVVGILAAYSGSDPAAIFDYMVGRGQQLAPSSVLIFKRLLTGEAKIPAAAVKDRTPRELFVLMADKMEYGAHWNSLITESASITLWRTNLSSDEALGKVPLGSIVAGLFKNQTRFNHLFVDGSESKPTSTTPLIFADVRFVVKHDQSLMSEPSPYYVRFQLDRTKQVWKPIEMIHVATVSGNSPALLF
jgi:hypothetical protein